MEGLWHARVGTMIKGLSVHGEQTSPYYADTYLHCWWQHRKIARHGAGTCCARCRGSRMPSVHALAGATVHERFGRRGTHPDGCRSIAWHSSLKGDDDDASSR